MKRQSLPKEDDGGSCVPEAVDVGKKVREAFDHQRWRGEPKVKVGTTMPVC